MVSLHYVSIITLTSYCTFLVLWLAALQGRGAMNPTTSALKNILFVGGLSQQGPQHWNRGNLPKYLTERDLNKNKRLCHFDMLQFYLNVFECIWMYLMFVHTDSYCNGCITHHPSCLGGWARCHSHFLLHEEDWQHQPEQLLLRVRLWSSLRDVRHIPTFGELVGKVSKKLQLMLALPFCR